jgi:hypothetical protein
LLLPAEPAESIPPTSKWPPRRNHGRPPPTASADHCDPPRRYPSQGAASLSSTGVYMRMCCVGVGIFAFLITKICTS